ncbi:MAG: hypothetical protein JSW26_10900 [Desulfobacterales bacterium]|nr:MAG: hypothetical protein JSW26_10900 [Desulfobacterales bacterium]
MNKYEYRCNRCLIIEEKYYYSSKDPSISVPCQKCGGLALRIPWSESIDYIFEENTGSRDGST